MSSARVLSEESSQEDDLQDRSTKKVKTRADGEATGEEIIMWEANTSPKTYKEHLLNTTGDGSNEEELFEDAFGVEFPEDKWYKETDEDPSHVQGELDPCPMIPMSHEEYADWCQPWRLSLIVKVLGKKVGFKTLETKLHRS